MNEDFWLQISTDGGGSYTTVEEWNQGDEFGYGDQSGLTEDAVLGVLETQIRITVLKGVLS